MKSLERFFKFLASFQLAVIIMSCLGVLAATGTIFEARYDANYAQKLIYNSPYMYATLAMLCLTLFNVMVDRWPWKRHHAGFVLAHIGIILLVSGAYVTHRYGVDGSLVFEIGQTNRSVMLSSNEVVIAEGVGDGHYPHLDLETAVDFLLHPPSEKPIQVQVAGKALRVDGYYNFAVRDTKLVPIEDENYGPAVRVQLENSRVNMTQWVHLENRRPYEISDLGPAQIILATREAAVDAKGRNAIIFRPAKKTSSQKSPDKLSYEIFTRSQGGRTAKGEAGIADQINTGWMGIQLRIIKYLPHAKEQVDYTEREQPTGTTVSAMRFHYDGKEYWTGLNDPIRLPTSTGEFVVAYRNRLLDDGVDITLKNFSVGRYEGSKRAMSYQSEVVVPGLGERTISMNNPLKYNGYTFYQASFQEDSTGHPTVSILSVNRDPGRWVKYLGSLLIVLGSVVMFYFKHYRGKIFASLKAQENTKESA